MITELSQCEDVAAKLPLEYRTYSDRSDLPRGCFNAHGTIYSADIRDRLYFNAHETGAANEDVAPVCARDC